MGAQNTLQMSKAAFIRNVMQCDGLHARQVVLVEDDPMEITSVRQARVCRAIFVRRRQGMMAVELERIRRLAGPLTVQQVQEGREGRHDLLTDEADVACSRHEFDSLLAKHAEAV